MYHVVIGLLLLLLDRRGLRSGSSLGSGSGSSGDNERIGVSKVLLGLENEVLALCVESKHSSSSEASDNKRIR